MSTLLRIFAVAVTLVLTACHANAQFTTVTATVNDPNGRIYQLGTLNVSFFDPGTSGKLPTLGPNSPIPNQANGIGQNLDSFGAFSVQVADNGVIASASGATGTQWWFNICANANILQLPSTQLVPCFIYKTAIICATNTPVTCTANTMDISAKLQAIAAVLPPSAGTPNLDGIADGLNFVRYPYSEGPVPLVYNGGFETQAAFGGLNPLPPPGWFNDVGTTAAYETVSPCEGGQSLKMTWPQNPAGNEVSPVNFISASPGDVFYISGIVKGDGTLSPQIRMHFIDKTNTAIGSDVIATTASTSCTTITASGTAPANTVYAEVTLTYSPFNSSGSTWYDAIKAYRVNFPALSTPSLTIASGPAITAVQGNGVKAQLSTGTTTTNDVVKYDANGNTVDSGILAATPVQVVGVPFTGSSVVNASTTSPQAFATPCVTTPCYTAGQLNTVGKTFDIEGGGTVSFNTIAQTFGFTIMANGNGIGTIGSPYPTTPTTTATGDWWFKALCKVTVTGASGNFTCLLTYTFMDNNGTNTSSKTFVASGLSNVDLTATFTPDIGVYFSTVSTNNQATQSFAITRQYN